MRLEVAGIEAVISIGAVCIRVIDGMAWRGLLNHRFHQGVFDSAGVIVYRFVEYCCTISS